jgi:hypothetical protein
LPYYLILMIQSSLWLGWRDLKVHTCLPAMRFRFHHTLLPSMAPEALVSSTLAISHSLPCQMTSDQRLHPYNNRKEIRIIHESLEFVVVELTLSDVHRRRHQGLLLRVESRLV